MPERSIWQRFADFLARLFGLERRGSPDDEAGHGRPRERAGEEAKPRIEPDRSWTDPDKMPLDPYLRVALSIIQRGDRRQIFARTGIRLPGPALPAGQGSPPVFLPLHIEVTEKLTDALAETLRERLGLHVPKAYVDEAERNPGLRNVTAQMPLGLRGPAIDVEALRANLRKVIVDPLISRLNLATPMTPCDAESPSETLADFGLPEGRKITVRGDEYTVDGAGVIVGIIDDGCCLAHWNFLRDGPASRLLYIWDQGNATPGDGWTKLPDFPDGRELVNVLPIGTPIDTTLATHTNPYGVIDEDRVYDELDFRPHATIERRPFNASTHGTHVMDIAAGNGRALFGREGVAPAADLIFVQLPSHLVAEGGPALKRCIQDGAQYVFARAKQREAALGRPVPAVVNISYGNYVGPHDGSSDIEAAFDSLLAVPDRAIVVSAGNSFAARCHAQGRIRWNRNASLRWLLPSFDESMNVMEIWYTGALDVDLYLTTPDGTRLGPVKANGPRQNIFDAAGNLVGYIDHVGALAANGDNQIVITLHATWDGTTPLAPPRPAVASTSATAASGTWLIELDKTKATKAASFHAWIERDERRRVDPVRRRQSYFVDDVQARPRFTVTGMATGRNTIAVGAYNTATGEMAEYSACGPTRPSKKSPTRRRKPELCAPAAADARGRGVLSAATRFALSTRLGGTSASAPHVAGLAALLLQLNRDVNETNYTVAPLPIDELRRMLQEGAIAGATLPGARPLRPNRHQAADPHQLYKQGSGSIWSRLTGAGRAHAEESLKRVK